MFNNIISLNTKDFSTNCIHKVIHLEHTPYLVRQHMLPWHMIGSQLVLYATGHFVFRYLIRSSLVFLLIFQFFYFSISFDVFFFLEDVIAKKFKEMYVLFFSCSKTFSWNIFVQNAGNPNLTEILSNIFFSIFSLF